MALSDIADMSNNGSLRQRIVAQAARLGKDTAWANTNLVAVCATDGWDTKWSDAKSAPDAANYNPDTGRRTDVIDDDDIIAAVSALVDAENEAAASAAAAEAQTTS